MICIVFASHDAPPKLIGLVIVTGSAIIATLIPKSYNGNYQRRAPLARPLDGFVGVNLP